MLTCQLHFFQSSKILKNCCFAIEKVRKIILMELLYKNYKNAIL